MLIGALAGEQRNWTVTRQLAEPAQGTLPQGLIA